MFVEICWTWSSAYCFLCYNILCYISSNYPYSLQKFWTWGSFNLRLFYLIFCVWFPYTTLFPFKNLIALLIFLITWDPLDPVTDKLDFDFCWRIMGWPDKKFEWRGAGMTMGIFYSREPMCGVLNFWLDGGPLVKKLEEMPFLPELKIWYSLS